MEHSTKPSGIAHAWERAREHASNAVIGGLILVLTGFTPEHWVAEGLHKLHISERILAGLDFRLVAVSIGIAIIVGDTLWRRHRARSSTERMTEPDSAAKSSEPIAAARAVDQPVEQLSLPSKPSIVVLPFDNLGKDPGEDYFTDGMTEEITTALARVTWLFVIARNSAFTYKGRAVDIKQVGRELGVRYVLEGSVRRAEDRIRITAQLVDAERGAHLWADRFDSALKDIFDLQDQVATSVVGAIAPRLEGAEIERANSKPTGNLNAYDYFLRGMAKWYQWTEVGNNEALELFYRAIQLDPNFATPYALAASCYVFRKTNGWIVDRTKEIEETERLARRAAQLGNNDAIALGWSGHALALVVGDLDTAVALIDRALALNANLAAAWQRSGWVRIFRGEHELAIEHLTRAIRLNPLDPHMHITNTAMALAHFLLGQNDEAAAYADKALRMNLNWPPALRVAAASNALAGRLQIAEHHMMLVRALYPNLRVSNFEDQVPFRRSKDLARYQEGLRKAGLPD